MVYLLGKFHSRAHSPWLVSYSELKSLKSIISYVTPNVQFGSVSINLVTYLLTIISDKTCFIGIAMTAAFDISTDFDSSNQITDYLFVFQPFTLDRFNVIFRCATGLGPSGSDSNIVLGGWYFNGVRLFVPTGGGSCEQSGGEIFLVRGANTRNYPGVINLYLCGSFTTNEEGVYSCIMMNSSMMNQTMRVGVYFSGRSESLDMYPITSLLTIFYLSTQLLQ